MRITFVLPPASLSGGVRVVAIYAKALQRLGHRLTIVSTPGRTVPIRRKFKSLLQGRGWPRNGLGPSHLDGIGVEHRVIDRFRPITDADVPDADVVVATWWETAEWVWNLSPRKGVKAYFLQGFDAHREEKIALVERTWALPMHKIVVSRWLADLARERFHDEAVSLVPNGVDPVLFHAPRRGKQRICTIGFMHSPLPAKGGDIALEAIRRASGGGRLKVVSFSAERPLPPLELPQNAVFELRPEQHRLRHLYAACDAWLFPSRREGFGLPILEAMACRTPVIGTPTGAAPELLAEGGGVIVRPEDPDDMAQAIDRIRGMPQLQWQDLSDAAFETAGRRTWRDSAARFEAALYRACDSASRGTHRPQAAASNASS